MKKYQIIMKIFMILGMLGIITFMVANFNPCVWFYGKALIGMGYGVSLGTAWGWWSDNIHD